MKEKRALERQWGDSAVFVFRIDLANKFTMHFLIESCQEVRAVC